MRLEDMMTFTDLFKTSKIDPTCLEARFVSGDMTALEEIMTTHQRGIYQVGLRLFASQDKAADFCQDVFIKVYEKRSKYNPSRPIKPWLYQVAVNLGRDRLRQKREILMGDDKQHEPVVAPHVEDELLADETKEQVWKAMQDVKPIYREVLALRFSSEMSLKDIAKALGISLSAAKVRLCRGLRAFEDAYQATGGDHYDL